MTTPTITQDEYDALKVTLAARDAKIETMRAAMEKAARYLARQHVCVAQNRALIALRKAIKDSEK